MAYKRVIEEEEALLVHKGIEFEMQEIRSGKVKLIPFEKIKKECAKS